MEKLTWTCHICKRERPDEKISVKTHRRKMDGWYFQENVRYCNDNPECEKAAETFSHTHLGKDDKSERR